MLRLRALGLSVAGGAQSINDREYAFFVTVVGLFACGGPMQQEVQLSAPERAIVAQLACCPDSSTRKDAI